MRSLRFLLPFLAPVLLGGSADADEVHLNGGTILRGQLLSPDAPAKSAKHPVHLLLAGGDTLHIAAEDVRTIKKAVDHPQPAQHMRYVKPTKDASGGLDVAVTYYTHPDGGPRVDLVGAIHIGEASYYQRVQRLLERASVVLYEGIKPKDHTTQQFTKADPPDDNPVRSLQGKLAEWFGLKFQLDAVDYTRPHFVHADMTSEEFAGPPPRPVSTSDAPTTGSEPNDAAAQLRRRVGRFLSLIRFVEPLLDSATSTESARNRIKGTFARMFGRVDIQKLMTQMAPEMSDLLLTQRNDVVVRRLIEQRARKDVQNIAVFYGAAHMTGLETELTRLGYKRAGARWLRAWDVRTRE